MRRTTVQETVACSVMRWPPNRDFFARKESVTWSRPLRMRCLTRSHVWFPNAIASDRQSSHASFTRPPLLLQLDIVSISIWSTRSTQPNQVVSVQHHLETTSEAIGVENEDDDTPSCTRQQFDQISSQTRPSVWSIRPCPGNRVAFQLVSGKLRNRFQAVTAAAAGLRSFHVAGHPDHRSRI